MKKKTALFVGVVAAAALALTGCAGGTGSAAKADTALVIALQSPPISLDPSKAAVGLYSNYVDTTYGSLLNLNVNGQVVAGLADKWGYNNNNTEFHATLRKGVKWADGTPITAPEVVDSIKYFGKGSGPNGGTVSALDVSSQGNSTIVIKSPTPNPVLAQLLTPEQLVGAVISPAGLKNPANLAKATFGAGPYVYNASKSVTGDHYVFLPNRNYYDKSAIHYKSITIRVIADENSAVEALKSGQIDFMQGNADVAPTIKGSKNLTVLSGASIWGGVFLLDRDGKVVPALADVRVRQALNYAVDRVAITKAVYGQYGQPVDQPQAPGFDGYSTAVEKTYPYDPAKAKKLLAEAGYAHGLTIPVNYGTFDPTNTKLIQAVQAQLAQVGVTLQLKGATNFGGWVSDLVSKQYAATVLSPGAGGAEYSFAQSAFMPGGIMNIFGASDPKLTAAFTELGSASVADQDAAAQKVTEAATKNALSLPISAVDTVILYNTKLQGVQFIKNTGLTTFVTSWSSK